MLDLVAWPPGALRPALLWLASGLPRLQRLLIVGSALWLVLLAALVLPHARTIGACVFTACAGVWLVLVGWSWSRGLRALRDWREGVAGQGTDLEFFVVCFGPAATFVVGMGGYVGVHGTLWNPLCTAAWSVGMLGLVVSVVALRMVTTRSLERVLAASENPALREAAARSSLSGIGAFVLVGGVVVVLVPAIGIGEALIEAPIGLLAGGVLGLSVGVLQGAELRLLTRAIRDEAAQVRGEG